MKKLLALSLLITYSNVFALGAPIWVMGASMGNQSDDEFILGSISSSGVTALSAAVHPILGVVVFIDADSVKLDLSNQDTLDMIEDIQFDLEDGIALNEIQEAILKTGIENQQLDAAGNIL